MLSSSKRKAPSPQSHIEVDMIPEFYLKSDKYALEIQSESLINLCLEISFLPSTIKKQKLTPVKNKKLSSFLNNPTEIKGILQVLKWRLNEIYKRF